MPTGSITFNHAPEPARPRAHIRCLTGPGIAQERLGQVHGAPGAIRAAARGGEGFTGWLGRGPGRQYASNMRWTSTGSSVRVRASMARMRAFWGRRLSAATKPRSRSVVRGSTRPLPGPARQHDQHAVPACLEQGLVLRGGRHAGRERRDDDRPCAGRDEGIDGGAVGAGIGVRDVDARQVSPPPHVELGIRGMAPRRPAVDGDAAIGVGITQHAEVRAPERLESKGRGLGDLTGGLDLVVEDDEHAQPARLWRAGHADRAHEVHPGVGAEPAGRPLGAHDDDRDVVVDGEVQEVCRLLERRRAMGDHHAVERGFTRSHGVNRLGQEQPVGGSDKRAPDGLERHRDDLRDLGRLRDAGEELVRADLPPGVHVLPDVEAVPPDRRDRPARSDQGHAGLR